MRNFTRYRFFAIAIALVVLWPTATSPRAYGQDGVRDQQQQLLKRIIELLDSTAHDAKKWDDKQVAARTLAQIADLIWDQNRDNAREYLKGAWNAAAQVEEPKRERSSVVNPSVRNAVRRDVLIIARKRAPELAATWLDEMVEESKSAEKTDRGTFDDRSARSAVLLQMANQILPDNPKGAAELLIESLRDGISFNLQTVLLRLQEKDAALSESVFRAAVARLKTAGMSGPNELLTLYAYLYTPGRVFAANTSDNRNQVQLALGGTRVSTPAGRLNPAMAREFLEVGSDLLLSTPLPQGAHAQLAARSLVSAIGMLLREVTPQWPEKAALLRARAQQLDAEAQFSIAPVQRPPDIPETRPGESKESFAERRVDLLEETASKGRDVLTRDVGYATAAVATAVERYERGLSLAGKIEDKNLRGGVRSWLMYRAVLHLIGSGDLEEAQRLNLKNDDLAQRAVCFVVGAQRLVKDKDNARAGEWLREAGVLVKRIEPHESLARIALGMVSTYGRFDTQASLEWLMVAVKLIRKTPVSSVSETEGAFDRDQAPSLKRISGITPISDFTGKTAGFSLQSAVAVFPPDQFEEVLSVLNEIASPEARGLALLILCRTFLKTAPVATRSVATSSAP
ncbi:MAG: hypothetical protein LC794_18325 [Acidobacteria bacterium]|nr:hypothetical protein [Acidobacteriota bacterium]